MGSSSSFRGYWSIGEVVERMIALAQHNDEFRPDITQLTLAKKDYDLIRRWPKAAEAHQIIVNEKGVFWRRYTLAPAAGLGRYERSVVEQAEIT